MTLPAAVNLACSFLDAERRLGAGGHVVGPSSTRWREYCKHVHVDVSRIGIPRPQINGGASFMLKRDRVSPSDTTRTESPTYRGRPVRATR